MKIKVLTIAMALLVCMAANAQKKNKQATEGPEQEEWRDVEIFEQHKLYPRANVIPYGNENDIEKGRYENSPYYVSLNGEWQMSLAANAANRPTNMEQKDFDASGWRTVTVPSTRWEEKGEVATYYREFFVPKEWKENEVYLNIQAKSALYVWVNGQYVGYSEDSRDMSEFNLSKHLQLGKTNKIIVQVFGTSDGTMLETDYARTFNGITGDVYLVVKPYANIMDYKLLASYDNKSTQGSLSVNLDIFNSTKKGQFYVEMEVWDTKGRQVEKIGRWMVFDKKNELEMKFDRELGSVKPWTAETPNLYTLVLRLRDQKMNLLETVGTRFGFRNVAMNDGQLTVNGEPVTLCGTIYAYYDYENGGIPSKERIREDMKMMKQHNINAVRTSLYSPAAPYFYEMCDEYGLYVICDANLQPYSTQSKAVATDKAYINLFISRVQNMYERLKNHPSIIAWSLGNGQDNGVCMENAYRTLKLKDKERMVVYPAAGYSDNTDMIVPVNINYDDLKLFASKSAQPRPLVMATFGSTKGNNYGNIEPLWQLVRKNSSLQGGFASFWNPAEYYDNTHEKDSHIGGLVTKERKPMPYLSELRNIYRPFDVKMVGKSPDAAEFNVTNLLSFLTLNDYILEYNIFSNLKSRIIEGEVSVALKPGESKNFKLKIPALTLYAGEELFIRFTIRQRTGTEAIPKGTELGVVEFPLPMKGVKKEQLADYDREELFVDDKTAAGTIHIFNDYIELYYDLESAEIVNYKFHDRDMMLSTPQINFWRAATDNDRVDKNAMKMWANLGPDNLKREVIATNWRQIDKNTVSIDAMMRYNDQSENAYFDVKQSITVLFTGDVLIDNEIVATEQVKTLPKVGMQMCLPKTLDSVRWFGLDKETYVDRRSAGVAGTYKRDIRSMFFNYEKPQESGNRAGVRWVSVENGKTGFYVDLLDTMFNFSIYPYTDMQLFDAAEGSALKEQEFWTLNIDYRQAAIGSALAGNDIADADLITDKKYHFRMHLRAYDMTEYNPYDFCRVEYPEVKSSVLPMPVIKKDRDRFDQPMTITMNCENAKAEIHYTLDGSTPTMQSPLYKKPFTISASTYVKAKAFMKDATPSFTTIKRYNFDYITQATYVNKANTPYNFNAETALFDGETGDINELSRGWLGFAGHDLNVVLELSKEIELQQVVVSFAHVPDAWAFAPIAVNVYVSEDGTNYSPAISAKLKYAPDEESMNKPQKVNITIDVDKPNVKYVRLVAKNMGRIPAWHKARGLKPWIMVDEVQLNEVIK